MGEFDTIRPYNDSEVPAVLARLFSDKAFLDILTHFRFPRFAGAFGWLLKPLIAQKLRREFAGVTTVATLQDKVEYYVDHTIDRATDGVTYTGVEQLKSGMAYVFLANHRDIVMDPAFVNYAVYHAGLPTPRIAIGDNLLQKPFVSDLMRLNKSFIVHRSITGRREKMAAYQLLSAYINHSIRNDCQSIWIAQAEGRAKDGDDRTESAILKMFHMSRKDEPFADVILSLNLTPVSISYEYDPCDAAKARELFIRASTGTYSKAPGEDDASIALATRAGSISTLRRPSPSGLKTPNYWPSRWTGRSWAVIGCFLCITWRMHSGATRTRNCRCRRLPKYSRPMSWPRRKRSGNGA